MSKISIRCKIVDKRKVSGWFFGDSFYVTFKSDEIKPSIFETPCSANQYYDSDIGDYVKVYFFKKDSGKLEPSLVVVA